MRQVRFTMQLATKDIAREPSQRYPLKLMIEDGDTANKIIEVGKMSDALDITIVGLRRDRRGPCPRITYNMQHCEWREPPHRKTERLILSVAEEEIADRIIEIVEDSEELDIKIVGVDLLRERQRQEKSDSFWQALSIASRLR